MRYREHTKTGRLRSNQATSALAVGVVDEIRLYATQINVYPRACLGLRRMSTRYVGGVEPEREGEQFSNKLVARRLCKR